MAEFDPARGRESLLQVRRQLYLLFCKFKLSPFTRPQKASPSALAQLTVTVADKSWMHKPQYIDLTMVQNLEKRDTGEQCEAIDLVDNSNTTYSEYKAI